MPPGFRTQPETLGNRNARIVKVGFIRVILVCGCMFLSSKLLETRLQLSQLRAEHSTFVKQLTRIEHESETVIMEGPEPFATGIYRYLIVLPANRRILLWWDGDGDRFVCAWNSSSKIRYLHLYLATAAGDEIERPYLDRNVKLIANADSSDSIKLTSDHIFEDDMDFNILEHAFSRTGNEIGYSKDDLINVRLANRSEFRFERDRALVAFTGSGKPLYFVFTYQ